MTEIEQAEILHGLATKHGALKGRGFFVANEHGEPVERLNAGLYSGLAGYMLFLGALHRATGAAAYKRQMLSVAKAIERIAGDSRHHTSLNYYVGWGGALHALNLFAPVIGSNPAEQVANRIRIDVEKCETTLDMVGGCAGLVPTALAVDEHHRPTAERIMALAIERCLSRVRIGPRKVWMEQTIRLKGYGQVRARQLSGFAHGHSGVAYALFLAAEYTGESVLGLIALDLLAEEDKTYDVARANWLGARGSKPILMYAWCYGYVGALLVRKYARRFGYRSKMFDDARAATLESTSGFSQIRRYAQLAGPSICHGAGGLVLLNNYHFGDRVMAPSTLIADFNSSVMRSMAQKRPHFGTAAASWDNSLMNGSSGIGVVCLREHLKDFPFLLPYHDYRGPGPRSSSLRQSVRSAIGGAVFLNLWPGQGPHSFAKNYTRLVHSTSLERIRFAWRRLVGLRTSSRRAKIELRRFRRSHFILIDANPSLFAFRVPLRLFRRLKRDPSLVGQLMNWPDPSHHERHSKCCASSTSRHGNST